MRGIYRRPGVYAVAALVVLMGALSGCSEEAATEAPAATPEAGDPVEKTGIAALPAGWTSIEGGADTTCSDGSPYRFFVRPGDPDKLLFYMQGGGACWFRENCDPNMRPTYTINIPPGYSPPPFGIFNFNNQENPFLDYSVVMAPYCTADVHLGSRDTVYPGLEEGQAPLTVHHQGRANMQAVLEWTYAHVSEPDTVFVTGSSAGAIPSPYYAVVLADHYEQARIAHLGDGAGGYRRINEDTRPDEQWGTFDFITQTPGFSGLTPETFNYEQLYIAAAKARPDIQFAEYDAAEDRVQKNFLALGGSETTSLLEALEANHADIRREVDNFSTYIGGGESHTILRSPQLYQWASNGVSIRDWIADLAAFKPVENVRCSVCDVESFAGTDIPPQLTQLWASWEDPEQQFVEPFQIFDNLYYVGIDWVAAYVLETSDGLILIDSLYGKWVPVMLANMGKLGLDPADIKYLINTHGHFDHAGGSALLQHRYGARVVMAEEDWDLAQTSPDIPMFYAPIPRKDIVANDGDRIVLGDTTVELFKTPGHTEGVLTLRYPVRDGAQTYTAVTLGGVGLNFSGVERTETYLQSYARLAEQAPGVSVSLPNHAAMGRVFERANALAERKPGEPHPFVDPEGYQQSLATFIANAKNKLIQERTGDAPDPLQALTQAVDGDD